MLVVVDFFILLLLSVLLAFVDTGAALESSREFKVMTLNAFNFVDGPNWEKRVYEIREMVLRHDPDCVAFEEVDLKSHLRDRYPSWKYGTASMANEVDEEGIAIACKWAIHSASSIFMYPQVHCTDPLRRAVVQMSIAVGRKTLSDADVISADLVDIYATHWSYEDCNHDMNAMETLEFVNSTSVGGSAFILGDFNAFDEVTNSLKMMEQVPLYLSGDFGSVQYMKDSWRALYPDVEAYPGYTYSSLEEKAGLHNRCDRIYYLGRVTPLSAEVDCKNPNSEIKPSDHCAYIFTSLISNTNKEWFYQSIKRKKLFTQDTHTVIMLIEIVVGVVILAILNRKLKRSWR